MNGEIYDLTKLQHMLDEISGRNIRVKSRIASVEDAHKLIEQGYDIKYIAKRTGLSESAIAKYEEERRRFLATTRLPTKSSAYGFICGTSMTTYS